MTDAFDLLGITPSFRLDKARLEETQRQLSSALHPDRYAGRPASERRAALGKAIEVNAAVRQLKAPLERGQLLLSRLGAAVDAPADPEFLMEIMELREALRDAGSQGDKARIEQLSASVRQEQATAEKALELLFEGALRGEGTASPLLAQHLSRLRYYERFLTEADVLLDDLL